MLDPDRVAADVDAAEEAAAMAALVASYYEALRDLRLPEALCVQLVVDWHATLITDGVVWDDDSGAV